ncbi:hyaluronidase [Streptomyces sp. NHF165]|uniref:beta-N-acetylglucosaminidase domain-containing protein n=1 Tax=Streptomyces sp. NHF165 TaxID=2175864 RepID=UPI00132E7465|nr:hyaluronidase [Streptomyces sp. NHF165]
MATTARGEGVRPRGGRWRAGAVTLTAALVSSSLLGTSVGQAAPAAPDDGTAGASEDDSARAGLPPVWPRPQTMSARGGFVPAGREAVLVADEGADGPALETVRSVLRAAGVREIREETSEGKAVRGGLVVRVGRASAEGALRELRAPARGELPAGGYRLAAGELRGRPTVALDGADGAGLFHAAQTLRRLVTERHGTRGFPGVTVRDWPAAAVRGVTEGFYGRPWTHRQRLDQLDFLGRTKQNRYLYAPGDDPFRQTRWRDPYPAAERARFRELAERARRNHVQLGWAVAPGQSLCFSSREDRAALLRKLDAMWALGVRVFQLRFEDVSYSEWHCGADSDAYGSGPEAAARAQAELAGAVARHLAERHPGAEPLSVLPTEFYQRGATAYRSELARKLDARIVVGWSGVGVVPRTVSGAELEAAQRAFGRKQLLMTDNYPVNDFAEDRIFLGPYRGRAPEVATGSAGVLANAMEQPVASRVALFTAADFAWNPRGYRPGDSWRAAVDEVAGDGAGRGTRAAVHALAANDASSVLDGTESAYLRPLTDAFWSAWDSGEEDRLRAAGKRLRAAFTTMRTAPDEVPAELAEEVRPWLEQLARLGGAGEHAVDMLLAQARGDGAAAWRSRLEVRRLRDRSAQSEATVGQGVLKRFADRALRLSDAFVGARTSPAGGGAPGGKGASAGAPTVRGVPDAEPGHPLSRVVDGDPDTAYRAAGVPASDHLLPDAPPMLRPPSRPQPATEADGRPALTVRLPRPRPLRAVTVLTGPGSGTRARVEAHVPGAGWRRLGALSPSGWTQLDAGAHRVPRADAVRLVWARDTEPPVVHEVIPWYGDTPAVSLSPARTVLDAEVGGEPVRTHVRLTSNRQRDTHGEFTARAPRGFTVDTPAHTTVRRGSSPEVPLRITADASVRPGSHRIPVSFGGQQRTLTVRAHPRTGGPDLARTGRARSSADETGDFPAAAVADGRRSTRWSSPAGDGHWVRIELAERARVGKVVLHWQEAHASRYRVQVSPDGRRWRTAARVRDGRGGRETVRMDAPRDTRFVRVQGDERADARYGISLWSMEIYAVEGGDAAR